MKPLLDRMIDMIVAGLSGKAKRFYDTEFTFFGEITSISGKLKPYIKKSKPEKKVRNDPTVKVIYSIHRQRSMRRWLRSSCKWAYICRLIPTA